MKSTNYQLNNNLKNNHLHGGTEGFSRKNWTFIKSSELDTSSLTFKYISKDGEENYSSEVTVEVTYILNDENELKVHYFSKTT